MSLNQSKISTENITKFPIDELYEVIPKDTTQLKEIVIKANKESIKIHPISTGYNWGLGSRLPIDKKSIVLNLSKLNKITEYDEQMGILAVEPGVTQDDIRDFLNKNHSKYFLDVTGSSGKTSLIGNTLERGISYNSLRAQNVLGLEVLTSDGRIFKTGPWSLKNTKASTYPYGVGADLTGLFFQSNFGIVTKMLYKLQKTQNHNVTVQLQFKSLNDVAKSMKAFSKLMEDHVIDDIFHIGNSNRAINVIKPNLKKMFNSKESSLSNKQIESILKPITSMQWVSAGTLTATNKTILKGKLKELTKELKPYCKIRVINNKFLLFINKNEWLFSMFSFWKLIRITKSLRDLYIGRSTDDALAAVLEEDTYINKKNLASKVDASKSSFIYCLPITSLDEKSCLSMVNQIESVAAKYEFSPSITLNPIQPHTLEAVVSLDFETHQSKKAHECITMMNKVLIEKGHYPYRSNINDMDLFYPSGDNAIILKKIKETFDPKNIISTGRYLKP